MKVVSMNLLNVESGIIVHQVNNKRVMGAGIAKQIRYKYPKHYIDYMDRQMILGNIVATNNNRVTIVGFISQDGYGRDRQYTDYKAFEQCLILLKQHAENNQIYFPYRIGCGLAGGNWTIISKLIDKHIPNAIICRI